MLAVLATLLFGLRLGARDLWNPNEPTYGQAVAEMAARGDWTIPTVNGAVFGEKPILYYWLALAAAAALGGVDELALRAPSAAAGVAAVCLTYLLVLPYAGRRRARLAAVLLATTYIVYWTARSVQMDLLLTACTLVALLAATRVVDHGLDPRRGAVLCGVAAGLGVLAKGPVALIHCGLPLAVYLVATRRVRALASPAVGLAAGALLAVALPWHLWLLARGQGDYLVELLYRQNVARFREPWDHGAPWWYFLQHFWLDMAPWAFFLPLASGLRAEGEPERRLHRLAWSWIAAIVIFFSLSASKRSPYVMPVAPAVALLVAAVAERFVDGRLGPLLRALGLGSLAVLAAIACGAGTYLIAGDAPGLAAHPQTASAGTAGGLLMLVGGLVVLGGVLVPGWRRAAPALALGFVLALYVAAAAWLLPAFDVVKSHRAFCEDIRAHAGEDRPLRGYRLWKWRASYSYYSGREVRSLGSPGELRAYWQASDPVYLIVERGRLEEVRSVIGPAPPVAARGVGANFVYLFSNRRGPPAEGVPRMSPQ